MNIAELRANYPNPMDCLDNDSFRNPAKYCVGGALCLSLGLPFNFPTPGILWTAILQVNPKANALYLVDQAAEVIKKNDAGDFEGAWATLAEALRESL